MKKPSLKSLKKKAWKCFSVWVRKRGMDSQGYAICVTCGVKKPWKELHAGHFIHSHSAMTFLDERNVHPQCLKCNHFLSGNLIPYYEYMRNLIGQDGIDALRELRFHVWKPSRADLEQIIAEYQKGEKSSKNGPGVRNSGIVEG